MPAEPPSAEPPASEFSPDAPTRAPSSRAPASASHDDPGRIASTPVQTGRTEMASPEMVEQLKAEIAAAKSSQSGPVNPPPVSADDSAPPPARPSRAPLGPAPDPAPAAGDDLANLEGPGALAEARARVFARVAETLTPDGGLPASDATTRARARTEAQRLLAELASRVPGIEPRPWANRIAGELCGLGALSAPLAETDVTEVFVHGPERLLVRRGSGRPEPIEGGFSCQLAVTMVIRRLTGVWFSSDQPVIDARTLDGADVHAVHNSIATSGPVVTIALPGTNTAPVTLDDLVQRGALDAATASLLRAAANGALNILVCAGPGAHTYPFMLAVAHAASEAGHLRQLMVRPGHEAGALPDGTIVLQGDALDDSEDAGTVQSLLRAGLSLSPDRLLLHEASGPEAADALAALGRGLQGGIVSTRAGTVPAGIVRLAALAGLAGGIGAGLSTTVATDRARARFVADTFDLAIGVARFADGVCRVVQVSEPSLSDEAPGGAVDLALWDADGRACTPTGNTPTFVADLQRRGVTVDSPWTG